MAQHSTLRQSGGKIDALAISIVHILEQALKPQPLLRFQRFESIFP